MCASETAIALGHRAFSYSANDFLEVHSAVGHRVCGHWLFNHLMRSYEILEWNEQETSCLIDMLYLLREMARMVLAIH